MCIVIAADRKKENTGEVVCCDFHFTVSQYVGVSSVLKERELDVEAVQEEISQFYNLEHQRGSDRRFI